LLQARRERSGDSPAADLTASRLPDGISKSVDVVGLVRARKGNPASIPTVEILDLKRTMLMNEDRVIGNAKNVGGRLQGKAKQVEGAAEDVYGQVKESASDAVEAISESAIGAEDFLRTTIEERPYTAAAVALGIGYLIGRFGRRDNY
jgi:hypothetical protein